MKNNADADAIITDEVIKNILETVWLNYWSGHPSTTVCSKRTTCGIDKISSLWSTPDESYKPDHYRNMCLANVFTQFWKRGIGSLYHNTYFYTVVATPQNKPYYGSV